MAISQLKSKRKASGGLLRASRSKKKSELAGFAANTKLSEKQNVTFIPNKELNLADSLFTNTSILNVMGAKYFSKELNTKLTTNQL